MMMTLNAIAQISRQCGENKKLQTHYTYRVVQNKVKTLQFYFHSLYRTHHTYGKLM